MTAQGADGAMCPPTGLGMDKPAGPKPEEQNGPAQPPHDLGKETEMGEGDLPEVTWADTEPG